MNIPWILVSIVIGVIALAALGILTRARLNRIMNRVMFVIGLICALIAALLMVLTEIPSGYLTVLGIIGIGLIATSGIRVIGKK
jgi:hypothetical protein